MKICHLTSAHSSKDIRVFYKECVSLHDAGFIVYLVAIGKSRVEDGVSVVGIGNRPKNRILRMILTTRKVYRKAIEIDADIYHIHDPELLPYAIKLKRRGKKVIFDSHENILEYMSSKTYIPRCFRQLFSSIFTKYATNILSKIDAIVSVTPIFCSNFLKINHNTVLVTNYPILQREESSLVLAKRKQICFTGGLSKQWCIDKIIDAMEYINDVELILCGTFDDESYKKEIESKPGWKKCKYLGQVTHEKAVEIQRSSLAGMAILSYSKNTNNKEGTLGNTKLFEYFASNTPVICTEFNLWKGIVRKYDAGITVNPDSVEEIKDAIQSLTLNEKRSITMGNNGRFAVETEYNWDSQAMKLIELYRLLSKEN